MGRGRGGCRVRPVDARRVDGVGCIQAGNVRPGWLTHGALLAVGLSLPLPPLVRYLSVRDLCSLGPQPSPPDLPQHHAVTLCLISIRVSDGFCLQSVPRR